LLHSQLCERVRTWWLTPLSFEDSEKLRTKQRQYWKEMRENDSTGENADLADLGLMMIACAATEMGCERVLGDVARLVGKDRVSLNNASIMALLMFYYKKSRTN
jgi:hypothetical protein